MHTKHFYSSRRSFLKSCSVAAAATGLPVWFLERDMAAAPAPKKLGPNDRPGIALIGCGGMGKGDAYAQGIVDGYRATKAKLPAVVRIFGTNADLGKRILAESGIETYLATDFLDEGRKAVEIAQSAGRPA